tara:strand:- start:90 stop:890 length:801 start_codon:yes stop_codon:yes gene_type:complete
MTTEKNEATAAQQEDTQSTDNSNGVSAAAEEASSSNDNNQATIQSQIDSVLDQRLDQYGQRIQDIEKQEQGRAQQWYGEKLKETRTQDRDDIANFMSDLTLVLDEDQREQLAELQTTRQSQNLQSRIQTLEQQLEGQTQAASPPAMSQTDAQALFDATQGFIETAGLSISPEDSRLWAGYQNGMSLQQAINVARRNIKTVSPSPTTPTPEAKPAEAPQQRVPPSTASAPTSPADSFDTLAELAVAFRDREINSQDYARISRERGWL